MEALAYWKKRCELTEKCLKESPCDPDITNDQIKAHKELREFIDNNEKHFVFPNDLKEH